MPQTRSLQVDRRNLDLKTARLAAGLTQREVAAAVNRSPGYYARLERGLETPSLPLLRELACVLGMHELYRSLQPILRPVAS